MLHDHEKETDIIVNYVAVRNALLLGMFINLSRFQACAWCAANGPADDVTFLKRTFAAFFTRGH